MKLLLLLRLVWHEAGLRRRGIAVLLLGYRRRIRLTWLVGEGVTSGRIPVRRGMVGGTAEPRGRASPTREGSIGGVRALEWMEGGRSRGRDREALEGLLLLVEGRGGVGYSGNRRGQFLSLFGVWLSGMR